MNVPLRRIFSDQISVAVKDGRCLLRRDMLVQNARRRLLNALTFYRDLMNQRKTGPVNGRAEFGIKTVVEDGREEGIDGEAEGDEDERQHRYVPERQT